MNTSQVPPQTGTEEPRAALHAALGKFLGSEFLDALWPYYSAEDDAEFLAPIRDALVADGGPLVKNKNLPVDDYAVVTTLGLLTCKHCGHGLRLHGHGEHGKCLARGCPCPHFNPEE